MNKIALFICVVTLFSCNSKPPAQVEPVVTPPAAVQNPVTTQGNNVTINTGIKLDTINLFMTKKDAAVVIAALQSTFPTVQNSPDITVKQLNQYQVVFNYLAQGIFKKYPDLIPKKTDTTKKK